MPAWTCPFCSLLCDDVALDVDTASPQLRDSDCPRARAALAGHALHAAAPRASIDGVAATVDAALAVAAERLAQWRQPLFGGLGTDIAGARVLARLAQRTAAICDAADGAALMHGLRALQDRGQQQTTLGEIRARADLLLCIGTPAVARYPEFFRRCGIGVPGSPCAGIVFLGAPVPDRLPPGVPAEALPGSGDLVADVQRLAALVQRKPLAIADPALAALAERLRQSHYAVLVWEGGALPAHGALVVEGIRRIVDALNASTRAAAFPLGGSDGAASVNQVHAWLTGLPLRSRAGPTGFEHEPLRYDARRLLADRAVDGVLWIASFDPGAVPPAAGLPSIVLGPPAMAARLPAEDCVYVSVATPGLGAAGHLLRTDGIVVVPLERMRDDGLPAVADVLARIEASLPGRRRP